jgi:hypothetical protein
MKNKFKVFGQRFCTYCGSDAMYYIEDGEQPRGFCCECDNVDWCDNETVEDVKKRYGDRLHEADIDFLTIMD